MTEIPEHLLKRSRERRSAIGGGDDTPTGDSPSGEAVAAEVVAPLAPVAAAAVPEPAPVPKPVRPEVAAALSRRKIPFWAMPVLAGLPLWAYVYQATLEPAPARELTPFDAGEEIYAGCGSCHGATGAGNASAPGLEGALDTWPDFRDHMMWVRLGNTGWFEVAGAKVYGAAGKPTNGGSMPKHTLSDEDLARVVLYERVEFGGMEEAGEEYELLLAIAEGEMTFEEAGLGELSIAAGIDEANLASG